MKGFNSSNYKFVANRLKNVRARQKKLWIRKMQARLEKSVSQNLTWMKNGKSRTKNYASKLDTFLRCSFLLACIGRVISVTRVKKSSIAFKLNIHDIKTRTADRFTILHHYIWIFRYIFKAEICEFHRSNLHLKKLFM